MFITNALAGKSKVVAISAAQHKTDPPPAGDTVIPAETNRTQDIALANCTQKKTGSV